MTHEKDIEEKNNKAKEYFEEIEKLLNEVKGVIVGQDEVIKKIIVCLLIRGHALVEGNPGLAKTLIVKEIANSIMRCECIGDCKCNGCKFQRIQFTPDLLPSDITGTRVFLGDGKFETQWGPIVGNFILADEINRAPPKVHSALLEVMQDKKITIHKQTKKLTDPFMVLATQNPIESEGVYRLPEAQLDRFALKINIGYLGKKEEIEIIKRFTTGNDKEAKPVVKRDKIIEIQEFVPKIHIDDKIIEYIIDVILKTRKPFRFKEHEPYIRYGVSSRASIFWVLASKATALLDKRGYVSIQDVKDVAKEVLRHRLLLTYEAEENEVSSDNIIDEIIEKVKMPT